MFLGLLKSEIWNAIHRNQDLPFSANISLCFHSVCLFPNISLYRLENILSTSTSFCQFFKCCYGCACFFLVSLLFRTCISTLFVSFRWSVAKFLIRISFNESSIFIYKQNGNFEKVSH